MNFNDAARAVISTELHALCIPDARALCCVVERPELDDMAAGKWQWVQRRAARLASGTNSRVTATPASAGAGARAAIDHPREALPTRR